MQSPHHSEPRTIDRKELLACWTQLVMAMLSILLLICVGLGSQSGQPPRTVLLQGLAALTPLFIATVWAIRSLRREQR